MPKFQSAYRQFRSTEMALIKIFNDLLLAADQGQVSALCLLDLTSAFDTVDHSLVVTRLQRSIGVEGGCLAWFTLYLSGRSYCVVINGVASHVIHVMCLVQQGSILGPLLFILYILLFIQSVLNAAARLIFSARWSDHITPLLHDLHWLRVPKRIQFRLCVLAFRCLHGTAPTYLAKSLQRTNAVEGRRHLRSADTLLLTIPPTQRSTLGDCSFPAAAARSWNRLPASIRNASSVATVCSHLKNHLFHSSYYTN